MLARFNNYRSYGMCNSMEAAHVHQQRSFYENEIKFLLDILILHTYFLIIKISNFQGDLSDISAETATLSHQLTAQYRMNAKHQTITCFISVFYLDSKRRAQRWCPSVSTSKAVATLLSDQASGIVRRRYAPDYPQAFECCKSHGTHTSTSIIAWNIFHGKFISGSRCIG